MDGQVGYDALVPGREIPPAGGRVRARQELRYQESGGAPQEALGHRRRALLGKGEGLDGVRALPIGLAQQEPGRCSPDRMRGRAAAQGPARTLVFEGGEARGPCRPVLAGHHRGLDLLRQRAQAAQQRGVLLPAAARVAVDQEGPLRRLAGTVHDNAIEGGVGQIGLGREVRCQLLAAGVEHEDL